MLRICRAQRDDVDEDVRPGRERSFELALDRPVDTDEASLDGDAGSVRAATVTSQPVSRSRLATARPIWPVPPRMNA